MSLMAAPDAATSVAISCISFCRSVARVLDLTFSSLICVVTMKSFVWVLIRLNRPKSDNR